jgi:proteasome lid subunit RPN8/RPN11
MFVYDFDAPVVDLDAEPRPDTWPKLFAVDRKELPRCESMPLYTETVGEVALTVIRITADGRTRHQVYAITQVVWTLVAIYGLYMDAMSEVLAWRRYLDGGGIVAAWYLAHPDGVTPETRLV